MAKIAKEDILAYLEEASILDLNDLVKAIEEKFGVSAAAPVAVAAAAPAEEANAASSTVSVILTNFGEAKTAVIKVVKEITGLGLVEAKGLVDKCPSPIKENIPTEEAEAIKKKLTDAGASVDLK